MHKTILFALVILSGLSAGALAANQVIHQQGRVFSSESVTIKKGDALTFVNDDTIPHNIMSGTKGSEFNLGSPPAPGMSTDVTFKETGDVQVICAIHPRMKMMVKVTDESRHGVAGDFRCRFVGTDFRRLQCCHPARLRARVLRYSWYLYRGRSGGASL